MKPQSWLYIPLFSAIALLASPTARAAQDNFADIRTEIAAQHDEGVQRLQDWIKLPSIAAMDLDYPQGQEHMARLLKEAGFQEKSGHPSLPVFSSCVKFWVP